MRKLLKFSARYGFVILLIALLCNIILIPLSNQFAHAEIAIKFGTSLIVGATVILIAHQRHAIWPAIIISIPALINAWLGDDISNPAINLSLTLCYSMGVAFFLFYYILTTRTVQLNTLFAAMSLYLIIALNWAYLYTLIELFQPGSFTGMLPSSEQTFSYWVSSFIYYSIVTLSTLGYGDITPVSSFAQIWTALEAIVGQFYMAIILARLVALYLVRAEDDEDVE